MFDPMINNLDKSITSLKDFLKLFSKLIFVNVYDNDQLIYNDLILHALKSPQLEGLNLNFTVEVHNASMYIFYRVKEND